MTKPGILLIGAGGHAMSCIDVIESEGRFEIAGLVGTETELGRKVAGYEVIATDKDLAGLASKVRHALVTVGQLKTSELRIRLYRDAHAAGFELPTIVSPYAHVSSHAKVGDGSIVMFGAMVNAGASVGANCIVNSRALIEHDASVGDNCHISTGAIVNGHVRVGSRSFVGSGAVIRHTVTIGEDCLISMGSVVRRDLPDRAFFKTPEE